MLRLDNKINENVVDRCKLLKRQFEGSTKNGRILQLDGDKRYCEKSAKYYKKVGLECIVKSVPENRQAMLVCDFIKRYNPDILVITGHDGMINPGVKFNDIYNYRNSRHFIRTVKMARQCQNKDLVIIAGACQSYFEGLMEAGANFASSPARILIDFMDPLIVAETIAKTDSYKFVNMSDLKKELKNGLDGIGGIGAFGKKC